MNDLFQQIIYICHILFNKTILVLSTIAGVFLTALGYPKPILIFVVVLVCLDLITKHYAIVKSNYGKFSIHNYIKG